MKSKYLANLKILLLVLCFAGIVVYIYTSSMTIKEYKTKLIKQEKQYNIYDTLNSITLDTFYKKVNSGETFIVYMGNTECTDCSLLEPLLRRYLDNSNYKDNIVYLNIQKIRKSDEWNSFSKKYNIKYMPTFALYRNGKLYDKVQWTPDKDLSIKDIDSFLKNNLK